MKCKLICDKCENAIKKIPSNSIDGCVTDEPYGVGINPDWDRHLPPSIIWNEVHRILKPGSYALKFAQPSMIPDNILIMNETEFEYRDMWIWHYQGTHTKGFKMIVKKMLFRSRMRNVYNPILVYRKGIEGSEKQNWEKYGTGLLNIDENRIPYKGNHDAVARKFEKTGQKHLQSKIKSNTFKTMGRKGWVPHHGGAEPVNVIYVPRAKTSEKTAGGRIINPHETVKPITLMKFLVSLITHNKDQTIIDPFMGTGSTGCACKLLNRNFIGIDMDPNAVKITKMRIKYID